MMLSEQPDRFKEEVQAILRRHARAVNTMAERGMALGLWECLSLKHQGLAQRHQ